MTLYAFGAATDLSTTSIGNNDLTITTGFTPRLIKLHYFLQGHDRTTSTNQYFGIKGIAIFNGTTLVSNTAIWGALDGQGSAMSGDDGSITGVIGSTHFPNTTNSTPTLSAGTNTGTNSDIMVTLTINSVSSTGFVIRRATTGAGGTTARAKIYYEAFA